jgi:hypothetical protein
MVLRDISVLFTNGCMFLEQKLRTASPNPSPPPPRVFVWILNFSELNIDPRSIGFIKTFIGDFFKQVKRT